MHNKIYHACDGSDKPNFTLMDGLTALATFCDGMQHWFVAATGISNLHIIKSLTFY